MEKNKRSISKDIYDRLNTSGKISIIVAGCGKIGQSIIEKLYKEGFSLTVIDKDPDIVTDIVNKYDILGVVGNAASEETLSNANITSANIFIAVTRSDEFNLLACGLAKGMSKTVTIARTNTPAYIESTSLIKKSLGIDLLINPSYETAMEISRIVFTPAAYDVTTFAHGQAYLVRILLPENSKLIGKSISEIDTVINQSVVIAAIYSNNEVIIPDGSYIFKADDEIAIIAKEQATKHFLKLANLKNKKIKECMIIGGGKCTYFLAKELIHKGINVKIIEKDAKQCEFLSEALQKATIIHGDGTNEGLLLEEGIGSTEAFIPFTGIDEINVMLSLHAKLFSDAKIITKQDRTYFADSVKHLNLDCVIYPQDLTNEIIIAYARALRDAEVGNKIKALYHMYDNKVEAIEFSIDSESDLTNIPLKDLKIKENVIVAFINRNDKIIIPKGNDCIMVGDTVMIVTRHTGYSNISQILV